MITSASQKSCTLGTLLDGETNVPIENDIEISGFSLDSRHVQAGQVFVGLPGNDTDGRGYIDQAVNAGAAAVLYESEGWNRQGCAVPAFPIDNLRQKIGQIASRFYGFPSRALCVIGLTGTNGKTTCAGLLAQALTCLGHRTGFIGTVGSGLVGALEPQSLTTPDAVTVQAQLADLLQKGADSVCIEVSSHALDQGRVKGVEFDAAVFTNLSRDHLDYHQNMEAYAAAKLLLFRTGGLRTAVINADDPWGAEFAVAGLSARVCTYGMNTNADVYPLGMHVVPDGYDLILSSPAGEIVFHSPLLGEFNVMNTLAVVSTLLALEFTPTGISEIMPRLQPVSGRMELVDHNRQGPQVIVDYAHTPSALEQALKAARVNAAGRVWCVFGCGGERDPGKRPLMGAIAESCADHVVLTSDNSRGEDPVSILEDILSGMTGEPSAVQPDRKKAIQIALKCADKKDVVLIAGKGHELEQIVGSDVNYFSDQDTVRQLLEGNK